MPALSIISSYPGDEAFALTRPRFRVISRTKWEVNITRKYSVASSAMVFKIDGILSPCTSDLMAKKTINKNARRSGSFTFLRSQRPKFRFRRYPLTVEEGDADSRNL